MRMFKVNELVSISERHARQKRIALIYKMQKNKFLRKTRSVLSKLSILKYLISEYFDSKRSKQVTNITKNCSVHLGISGTIASNKTWPKKCHGNLTWKLHIPSLYRIIRLSNLNLWKDFTDTCSSNFPSIRSSLKVL